MTGREQARERLQQHRLIWAYGTINDWGNRIDPGPKGDWARRVRGIWLWQLGHQIEQSGEFSSKVSKGA